MGKGVHESRKKHENSGIKQKKGERVSENNNLAKTLAQLENSKVKIWLGAN